MLGPTPTDPGVAFYETTVAASSGDVRWDISTRNNEVIKRAISPGARKGPRSLTELAQETVIQNLQRMTAHHLEGVEPVKLVAEMYRKFRPGAGLTLHEWKVLSAVLTKAGTAELPQELVDELHRFRLKINHPSLELGKYTGPIDRPLNSCDAFNFLSFLTIDTVQAFRTEELVAVAKMGNLVGFQITEFPLKSKVTDNVVRGWSETENAFPCLRFLDLNRTAITARAIQYLSELGSLQKVQITGKSSVWRCSKVDKAAEAHGWQVGHDEHTGFTVGPDDKPTVHLKLRGEVYPPLAPRACLAPGHKVTLRRDDMAAPKEKEDDKVELGRKRGTKTQGENLRPNKRQKMTQLLSSFHD